MTSQAPHGPLVPSPACLASLHWLWDLILCEGIELMTCTFNSVTYFSTDGVSSASMTFDLLNDANTILSPPPCFTAKEAVQ